MKFAKPGALVKFTSPDTRKFLNGTLVTSTTDNAEDRAWAKIGAVVLDGANGGTGGTQSAGGTGGNNDHGGSASNGALLLGGNGGPGSSTAGGGGGGGYYGGGGGGGANSNSGGGGGGGSSYGNPAYVTIDDHATGNSSGGITGPGPLVTTHLAPNWHSRGGGGAYPAPERNPFGSATSSYGGKARAVITTPTWTRTVNYSGVVEQIPMNYSPAGLNFVVAANAQYDGPYDYGMGCLLYTSPSPRDRG